MKVAALLFVILLPSVLLLACYEGAPVCRPGTVDWPRCEDVTQPKFPLTARDGGGQ